MHSPITYGNGLSLEVLFRRENGRCQSQNDSLQSTYGMFRNRMPSKSNNGRHAHALCLLFYVSFTYLLVSIIYGIFYFGIWVPNMIAQKLKNTLCSPPSTSCLTKPVLTNCLILSNSRYNTNCYAWTMWPSYPTGWPPYHMGWGKMVFAIFCEIVHLIWVS